MRQEESAENQYEGEVNVQQLAPLIQVAQKVDICILVSQCIFNLLIGYVFFYFAEHETSDLCINLQFVCLLIGINLLVFSLLELFVFVPIYHMNKGNNNFQLNSQLSCFHCVFGLVMFTLFIALLVTFFQNESCVILHEFTEVVLIVGLVILILIPLIACCFCCCSLVFADAIVQNRQSNRL